MGTILEIYKELLAAGILDYCKEWKNPAVLAYLQKGESEALAKIPSMAKANWPIHRLIVALDPSTSMDATGRRFLRILVSAGNKRYLSEWMIRVVGVADPLGNAFANARALLTEAGYTEAQFAALALGTVSKLAWFKDRATPAGEYFLGLQDEELLDGFAGGGRSPEDAVPLATLFLEKAPERWNRLLLGFSARKDANQLNASLWTIPLTRNPALFLEAAAAALASLKGFDDRLAIASQLRSLNPGRFAATTDALACEQLLAKDSRAGIPLWYEARDAALWLVRNVGAPAIPKLQGYFSAAISDDSRWHDSTQCECKVEALNAAIETFGTAALPLLESCFETPQGDVQVAALQHWIKLADPTSIPRLSQCFRRLLKSGDSTAIARALRFVNGPVLAEVEPELWDLFAHKSRPVRDAAASAVARLGESRIPKAAACWNARKADARLAAVAWLKALGTPAAASALRERLDAEEDDAVRDGLLLALESLPGSGSTLDPAALRHRMQKTLAKAKGAPAPWLDVALLSKPRLRDGSPLDESTLNYLLYRQSRVKEMRADIEARPLYDAIDRSTSGDLALQVLKAYFASPMDADYRWAMALAALLGDDRLVPVFSAQIRDWADSMRGKLAEYGVQALALLGTDTALLTVDALSIRYRSKNKNIGKAATEAFAEAAQARGLTVEELGDLVVPWLGFKPGELRRIPAGKATLEVRLGPDFKLGFKDAATGKKVAKIPDSAPAEIKAEFKEIQAALKEAVKCQLLRMETLMVRQFRWTTARWQELFRQHPLLMPFAQRLVWGAYDANGTLQCCFRSLEDGSLTDVEDNGVELPAAGRVGVLHPLELDAAGLQRWKQHFADYNVEPPFLQLDRPVVTVPPAEVDLKFSKSWNGQELNALTFKGRAERLGWARGSVCDAGGIGFYLKTFPSSGVDVFLGLEDMFVGVGMDDSIKLGEVFFVKHGSVKIGGYEYDEPADAKDHRLVRFGDVPPIAFSEAMGDLTRIAAKAAAEGGAE